MSDTQPEDSQLTDLCKMIARRQVVVVVGSGVSMTTNPQSPTWRGLIESGTQHCRETGSSKVWCDMVSGQLSLEDEPDMLLSAAELVHQKLRSNGGGELARWLREVFASLQPESPDVIQALAALGLPIVTTNYDDLIEKVTGQRPVRWTESGTVTRVVRGDDRRVMHLHGHWEQPESVVLGIRSYESVTNNDHTQAVMHALGMTGSFLFVGCGEDGLADPNWGSFLSWLRAVETKAGVEHRHYRLVRKSDIFEPQGRLFPMVYGENFDDLGPFLRKLIPQPDVQEDSVKVTMVRVPEALPESVTAEAAEGLAEVSPDPGLGRDGQAFLERMRDEAGILAMEGEGNCGFLHLSFQEYLAAEHAAREGLARELASVATDSWWRESALLSLRRSRPFCADFFREMLNAGIAEDHPDLAERCLTEALYFVSAPFVEVLKSSQPKAAKAPDAHANRVAAILRPCDLSELELTWRPVQRHWLPLCPSSCTWDGKRKERSLTWRSRGDRTGTSGGATPPSFGPS